MPIELIGRVETPPEIAVELVEAGPEIVVELVGAGPPGETPYIGANGNWWLGDKDTGTPATGTGVASDHDLLIGRDKEDQHPIQAVTGLRRAIESIPPPAEPLTNSELEVLLK